MKIPRSLFEAYQLYLPLYTTLGEKVRDRIKGELPPSSGWPFLDRIKSPESYAQKAETGRCLDFPRMEDVYACTILVHGPATVWTVASLVDRAVDVVHRRPLSSDEPGHSPEQFQFNSLRLICKLKQSDSLPVTRLHDLEFEVQIKTFLEHAWSLATHDTTYKGANTTWERNRIAAQALAMLEVVDKTLENITVQADSRSPQRRDTRGGLAMHSEVLRILVEQFPAPELPTDRLRLSQAVWKVLERLNFNTTDLDTALRKYMASVPVGRQSLSPYGQVIAALWEYKESAFRNPRKAKKTQRIFVPAEAEAVVAGIGGRSEYQVPQIEAT